MKLVKVLGWVVGVPVAAIAAFAVYQIVSDDMASDQTFARKNGMSLSECQRSATSFGQNASEARKLCESRVPK
jgi:hypothetical protein